jgi:cytosine/adenosine deaminase-related metal-dependent hydrolase
MLAPGSFEKLIGLELIDARSNIVHANNFDDDLIRALVDAEANFTVTAEVELQMGFGYPLTGKLRALGSPFTIGADVEPAAAGDMFTAMRTTMNVQRNIDNLALIEKGEALPDTATITCRDALEWVTVCGARMMRMSDHIGSLAPGKQADIVLLRSNDLNLFPVHDAARSIVRQAGPGNVDAVMVAGKFVKRDGRMLYDDLENRQAELLDSSRRILTDVGLMPSS